jgi:hypothetical protein
LTNDVKVDPNTGRAYTFTRNPDEQTSSEILLLKTDEMGRSYVDFDNYYGRSQYQVFKDKMRDDILMKIDTKEELDTYNEPEPNYGGGGGRSSGSGNKRKTNSLGVTVYENSNNALRTGNLKNLDTKKAKYVFQEGKGDNGQNSILVYDLDPDTGDYVLDAKGKRKVKRIYSADQLAAYIKGVNQSNVIPTELYNEGKDDWSYLNEGRYLKGAGYKKSDISKSPYSGKGELD